MKKNGREYLEYIELRLEYMDEQIDTRLERLAELRANAVCLSGLSNNERVQTSSSFDKTGDLLAKISELEKETDECIDRRADLVDKVTIKIRQIENKSLSDVLIDRYVKGKTDAMISAEIGISDRGVRKRAVRALSEFDKIYKKS